MPSNNITPSYVTVRNTGETITGTKAFTTSYISASSFNDRIELSDIITYTKLRESGDISQAYKVIFEMYSNAYPEKANEYDTLLKLYCMDYRRTVIAIEMQNFKKMEENDFTS